MLALHTDDIYLFTSSKDIELYILKKDHSNNHKITLLLKEIPAVTIYSHYLGKKLGYCLVEFVFY